MIESIHTKSGPIAAIMLAASLIAPLPSATAETTPPAGKAAVAEASPPEGSALADWWNGSYATGNWWGVRDTLADHGIVPTVSWRANLLSNLDGGLSQGTGFDEEFIFRLQMDMAKLTKLDGLKGLSATGQVRWRDGDGANRYVGAGMFDPSGLQAPGVGQWRLLSFYLTYVTPEVFGAKNFLTLSGGWQNPADFFLTQPDSKLFLNNTLSVSRGITVNGIPWGGSFATWGGYAKVQPLDWYYFQSGLYMAYPLSTIVPTHGLSFQGSRDPDANGLYWLTETGFTPKIGASKLPGRYAAGFLYWGLDNVGFNGGQYNEKTTVYLQADQMVFREPSPSVETETLGKDGKTTVTAEPGKPSNQGLRVFSLFNVAPQANNTLPFYFQTGLIYEGLIPYRDKDQLGVAFAYGSFSDDKRDQDRSRGNAEQTDTGALEISYRIQITKWAYVQPDFQYIVRPGGTGQTGNASVLGLQFGVVF